MEFLKTTKKRQSLLSELVYIGLNVGLAGAVLLSVVTTASPLMGILLVLVSKWRVFAVRPRYWFANVQANLVDVIVGVSLVLMMVLANTIIVQVALAALYAVWLLVIKPRSKHVYVVIQSGTALFLGVNALAAVSYGWMASLFVVAMWLIGYSTARHLLGHYEEAHASFYSLIWGFMLAQLGWLMYHWTIAYNLTVFGNVAIAQVAIVALALGFVVERAYASFMKHGAVQTSDIMPPAVLSLSITAVLLVFFSNVGTSLV